MSTHFFRAPHTANDIPMSLGGLHPSPVPLFVGRASSRAGSTSSVASSRSNGANEMSVLYEPVDEMHDLVLAHGAPTVATPREVVNKLEEAHVIISEAFRACTRILLENPHGVLYLPSTLHPAPLLSASQTVHQHATTVDFALRVRDDVVRAARMNGGVAPTVLLDTLDFFLSSLEAQTTLPSRRPTSAIAQLRATLADLDARMPRASHAPLAPFFDSLNAPRAGSAVGATPGVDVHTSCPSACIIPAMSNPCTEERVARALNSCDVQLVRAHEICLGIQAYTRVEHLVRADETRDTIAEQNMKFIAAYNRARFAHTRIVNATVFRRTHDVFEVDVRILEHLCAWMSTIERFAPQHFHACMLMGMDAAHEQGHDAAAHRV